MGKKHLFSFQLLLVNIFDFIWDISHLCISGVDPQIVDMQGFHRSHPLHEQSYVLPLVLLQVVGTF